LEDIDLAPAKTFAGVTAIRDGDFVGFAATTSFEAELARDEAAKTAKWKAAEHPSSDELYSHLRSQASSQRPRRDNKGSPDEAFKGAHKVQREKYHIAYIQHAPMEPRAAVAEWDNDRLTVWTGTQQPARVREDLARTFRLSANDVR